MFILFCRWSSTWWMKKWRLCWCIARAVPGRFRPTIRSSLWTTSSSVRHLHYFWMVIYTVHFMSTFLARVQFVKRKFPSRSGLFCSLFFLIIFLCWVGQPVLIGGTMGTCSYVLTGTQTGTLWYSFFMIVEHVLTEFLFVKKIYAWHEKCIIFLLHAILSPVPLFSFFRNGWDVWFYVPRSGPRTESQRESTHTGISGGLFYLALIFMYLPHRWSVYLLCKWYQLWHVFGKLQN